jgi:hypothetical protein
VHSLKFSSIFGKPSQDGLSFFRAFLIFATLFIFGCVSTPLQNESLKYKSKSSIKSICESESYTGDPDYKQVSEKEYVNILPNGEEIYIQTEVQRCEAFFSEGGELECGIQKTVRLVWDKNTKAIGNVVFLDSGCSQPNDPSLRMEPWDQNDVRVKKDLVTVEHYWNYYSRGQKEEDECMLRIFKIDRKKMKLRELKERACRQ